MKDFDNILKDMQKYTDMFPWYWISYGEKCYAFATIEAMPLKDEDPFPNPGTQLKTHPTKPMVWIGINGTEMYIYSTITNVEKQNGDTICEFIALSHAQAFEKYLNKNFTITKEA